MPKHQLQGRIEDVSQAGQALFAELEVLQRRFNPLGLVRQLAAVEDACDKALACFTKHRLAKGESVDEIIETLDYQFDSSEIRRFASRSDSRVKRNCDSLISRSFVAAPDRVRQSLMGLRIAYFEQIDSGLNEIEKVHKHLPVASELLMNFSQQLEWAQLHAAYQARVEGHSWGEIAAESVCSRRDVVARYQEGCHDEALFDLDEFALSSHPKAITMRVATFERLDQFALDRTIENRRSVVEFSLDAERGLENAHRLMLQRDRLVDRARYRGRHGYEFPDHMKALDFVGADLEVAEPVFGEGVSEGLNISPRANRPHPVVTF